MNNELDEQLVKKYPNIFKDRYSDMKSTAMCWGFECGDGWFWLIDRLCNYIQGYIDANPHLKIQQVVAVQVKEKFGGLRFYVNGGNEYIDGFISFAEHLSEDICEKCGSLENIKSTKGWIKNLCVKCMDEYDIKNNKQKLE